MRKSADEQADKGTRLADLEDRLERAMEAYCEWRKPYLDPYRYAENYEHLARIDRVRREIASLKASADDVVSKMRLLDNWRDVKEIDTGKRHAFTTPDGDYELMENDVTCACVVKAPDGELEGPFRDAQEAADWSAADWDEVFRGKSEL